MCACEKLATLLFPVGFVGFTTKTTEHVNMRHVFTIENYKQKHFGYVSKCSRITSLYIYIYNMERENNNDKQIHFNVV